jgi:hypothetical protein
MIRKTQRERAQICLKTTVLFAILTICHLIFLPKTLAALSPTPSPKKVTPTPTIKKSLLTATPMATSSVSPLPGLTSSPSATPLDEKVKEIRDTVKEKVKEKIQEIKDRVEKKGYAGILMEMTDSTLALETLTGERLITVDKEAKIIGANKKEVKLKDLEIDQRLICMGSLDENNILVAKRIVVVPKPAKTPPKKEAFFGRITGIDQKAKTISLVQPKKTSQKFQLKIVNKVTLFNSGTLADLKVGDLLVAVSSQEKEGEVPTALLINPLK